MHLVNTEPVTAVQRVIGKRLYTDPASSVSIYLECKAFRQRRGIFKVCLFCLVQLWNVFVRPSSTVHTNQHSVVVFCTIAWKMHVAQLFLSLSSSNTE